MRFVPDKEVIFPVVPDKVTAVKIPEKFPLVAFKEVTVETPDTLKDVTDAIPPITFVDVVTVVCLDR